MTSAELKKSGWNSVSDGVNTYQLQSVQHELYPSYIVWSSVQIFGSMRSRFINVLNFSLHSHSDSIFELVTTSSQYVSTSPNMQSNVCNTTEEEPEVVECSLIRERRDDTILWCSESLIPLPVWFF